ncbi:CBS domain-containing protein [Mucilaginibacter myungsuensis]|uniref:CBS domain-containing protein n=1 Tax=Mucilaginibacter myungsuensis TaxID=649104 RepID=A0A929PW91_9SPHI|nr:CBS domain-containing protein [Mucilaginibacter myungsuensis]MBE9661836.1 CBS domain-containing protein [Mucilaginibacter myungsuensis]MDN3599730.1 CBS domain-containing protein [Mucilaginibacter myungsuensis]
MLAIDLVTDSILPLHTSDTIRKAQDRMAEFRVRHLPIVNEQQFLGLLADTDLISEPDDQTHIGALGLSLINPYVLEHQHIYDVMRLFYEQQLTVVPVLNATRDYLGMISVNTMTEYFATLVSSTDPGGIIVLEIANRDNSLAHMAQIVESDNAQVLSSYIRSFPDSTRLEVTLKVNKLDISSIVATFLRYGYDVKATFNHTDPDDGTRDRYDSLMNYLNI